MTCQSNVRRIAIRAQPGDGPLAAAIRAGPDALHLSRRLDATETLRRPPPPRGPLTRRAESSGAPRRACDRAHVALLPPAFVAAHVPARCVALEVSVLRLDLASDYCPAWPGAHLSTSEVGVASLCRSVCSDMV